MLIQHNMTPGHRPWKKSILTGDALRAAWWPCPPFTWNNSISLALKLCILTWTTLYELNVISATPHSTYNVVPGSHWPLSGTSTSFALFSAAESFNRSTCRWPKDNCYSPSKIKNSKCAKKEIGIIGL